MKPRLQIPLLKLGPHGGTRTLVEFANYMASRGYGVRILLPHGTRDKAYDLDAGVTIEEIPFSLGHRYLDYLVFCLACPFMMRDGVLVANFFVTVYPVWLASFLFRRPYLYLVQDIETWSAGPLAGVLNFMCRLTWRSRRIISVYPHVADELKRRGIPLLGEVQAGVAEFFFDDKAAPEGKMYDLIVFPRREAWKRTDLIKKIIALYREKYGSLSVLCAFQDSAFAGQFVGLGCEELQPGNENELVSGFDRSCVTLFTSSREGLGMPPLEGMARGLPAVVYENGGCSIYMRDGENGFVIADGDDAGAVHALRRLLSDSALYARMSMASREAAKKLSTREACKTIETILRSVAGEPDVSLPLAA